MSQERQRGENETLEMHKARVNFLTFGYLSIWAFFLKGEGRGLGLRAKLPIQSQPSLYAATLTLRSGRVAPEKIMSEPSNLRVESGQAEPRPSDQV